MRAEVRIVIEITVFWINTCRPVVCNADVESPPLELQVEVDLLLVVAIESGIAFSPE